MPFDRTKWIDDFNQLEIFISEAYPNLDAAETNGLILPQLDQETRAKINLSNSNQEAFNVLTDFVGRFKDGHFHLKTELKKPTPDFNGEDKVNGLVRSTSGTEACQKLMGSRYKNFNFLFPTPSSLGFENVKEGWAFPTATLKLGKKRIGFLRISTFGQGNYPDICADEWNKYRSEFETCNSECQENFVYTLMPNRLLAELDKAIRDLETLNISALVLDVTANGGGTDWVGAVMRMLSSKEILCGQFAFIKHPHWTKHFQNEIKNLTQEIAETSEGKSKRILKKKLSRAKSDLEISKQTCNRSKIWTKNANVDCSIVVKRPVPECMPQGAFTYKKGAYSGRLFVLVDRGTASAAEDIVGRYKESKIATILGEKTHGSGCGYVDGTIPFELPYSKIHVLMPNCARYSRMGVNEVLGIGPDVVLPVEELRSEEFTRQLVQYLSKQLNKK